MRSSIDNDGFALLNKWKTGAAEVGMSFESIGKGLSISAFGLIVEVDSTKLQFSGSALEVLVNLAGAAFEKVLTEEAFRLNLDPRYSESAELLLASGDKVVFFGKPRILESGGVN